MSSELRLKKLRGSGGYVMAKVTDQQQMKGNLGGPDLFLAPIGRIDSKSITKHFCNTCEKEFENSPKIDYESPNEQVADNLVLVERGQYICNTCNSSIAEYREFKKTDEGQDIGMAKSINDENVTVPSSSSSTQPTPEPTTNATQANNTTAQVATESQPTPEPTTTTTTVTSTTPQPTDISTTQPQQVTENSVNSIAGMKVFDENAKKLGTAKQVGVDSAQTVVLIITQDDDTIVTVPWTRVKKIGDIVLLGNQDVTQSSSSSNEQQPGKCSSCGFSNKSDAKFCEECGNNLT